jgi:hypothetical protein
MTTDWHMGLAHLETDLGRKRTRAPRRKAAPRGPIPSEAQVQRAIIDALRMRGIMAVHVPNAGKRSAVAGKRLKGEGMVPGFPDLAVYGPYARHALLEVKRPGYTASAVSDAQHDMHARLRGLGATVAIVTSIDDALKALRDAGWNV